MDVLYNLLPSRGSTCSSHLDCPSLVTVKLVSVTDTLQPSQAEIKDRHFLEIDFVRVVSEYLKTEPDSEERMAFVQKQRRSIDEIAKVGYFAFELRMVCSSHTVN